MVRSMTGFGRAQHEDMGRRISIEIRSVNHRFFECSVRSPRRLHGLEADFRSVIKEYASRGKIDVFITYEEEQNVSSSLSLNRELVGFLIEQSKVLEDDFGVSQDMTVSRLLTYPDVIKTYENVQDDEEIFRAVEPVLREAAERFRAARESEGAVLCADILEKLDSLNEKVDMIKDHEPEIMDAYSSRLAEKTADLLADAQIDEARIMAEVVMYADKICTDEETVRLKSHIEHMRGALESGREIGRKLDFLAQEMNREANTILSKAGDILTSDMGIALKTEIEKIREQIQNIE